MSENDKWRQLIDWARSQNPDGLITYGNLLLRIALIQQNDSQTENDND